MKKAVAWLLCFKSFLRKGNDKVNSGYLTVKDLKDTERATVNVVQEETFGEELEALRKDEVVKRKKFYNQIEPIPI